MEPAGKVRAAEEPANRTRPTERRTNSVTSTASKLTGPEEEPLHASDPGEPQSQWSPNQLFSRLSSPIWAVLIFLVGSIYLLPTIFTLEFFRHTEADRTLISMSMLEERRLLVPKLLGDSYLTKPPLFYVMMSWIFYLTQSTSEWAARLISVLSGAALLTGHFLFASSIFRNRGKALLSTLILASCGSFHMYSSVAEIDMTFACLVAMSSFALYHGTLGSSGTQPSLKFIMLAYILVAVAFLTKGPTSLVFFGSAVMGLLGYYLPQLGSSELLSEKGRFIRLLSESRRLLAPHVLGAVVTTSILIIWVVVLGITTSFEDIYTIINEELIQRFIDDPKAAKRERGVLFYFHSIPAAFLPWSLCFAGFLVPRINKAYRTISPQCLFFVLASIGLPLLFHSLASGKSARYLFPIFPMLAILAAEGAFRLGNLSISKKTLQTILGLAGIITGLGIPVFISVGFYQGLGVGTLFATSLVALPASLVVWKARSSQDWSNLFLALTFFFFGARCIQGIGIDALRNKNNSVKPIVNKIIEVTPPNDTLYVMEMFERWVPYYLERKGRKTLRLTPSIAQKWSSTDDSEHFLIMLNKQDEFWRLKQIQAFDSTAKIEHELEGNRHTFLLVSVKKNKAAHFNPKRLFPTNLTVAPDNL